jgi:hypothetical protein
VLFGVNNFIYPFFLHVSPLDKHGFWGKQLNKVYIKKKNKPAFLLEGEGRLLEDCNKASTDIELR